MMLGNYKPGPDTPPPPETEDSGPPAPLISKILYVWAALNIFGSFLLMVDGMFDYAIVGLVSGALFAALGLYLNKQSDRQEEMVRLMREQQRRQ